MLREDVAIDKIEVLEFGEIQVREAHRIYADKELRSETYRRHVLVPGSSLEGQAPRVQAVANAVWTRETLEAYLAMLKTQAR